MGQTSCCLAPIKCGLAERSQIYQLFQRQSGKGDPEGADRTFRLTLPASAGAVTRLRAAKLIDRGPVTNGRLPAALRPVPFFIGSGRRYLAMESDHAPIQ